MGYILEFKIDEQIITRIDNIISVSKTQNYFKAHFTFSDVWNNYNRSAYFKAISDSTIYEIPLDDTNTCVIPTSVLKDICFMVWCKGIDENEQVLFPTNMIAIKQILGGTIEEGSDPSFVWVADAIKDIKSSSISYYKKDNVAYLEVEGDTYKADEVTLSKIGNVFQINETWSTNLFNSIKAIADDYLTSVDKKELKDDYTERLSILENKVVPRRLSLFEDLEESADNNKAYVYVDNDGRDAKLSLFSFKNKISATTIKKSTDIGTLQTGDYVFTEI